MATRNGMVKKTDILEYQNVRKTGLTAIVLRDNDELIEVKATNGDDDIFLITKNVCRFVLMKKTSDRPEELPWV